MRLLALSSMEDLEDTQDLEDAQDLELPMPIPIQMPMPMPMPTHMHMQKPMSTHMQNSLRRPGYQSLGKDNAKIMALLVFIWGWLMYYTFQACME